MFCKVDEINFYYEEYGEGTPILFLSGFATDITTMRESFEPILKNYRLKRIYLDHPGVGKTVFANDLTITNLLSSIENFVNKVFSEKEFLVVGASFGGYLSRSLLNTFKERMKGLFLLYPLVTHKINGANIEEDVILKKNLVNSSDENVKERIQNEVMSSMGNTNFLFLNNLVTQAQELNFDIKSTYYNEPVCILTGRQDAEVGYKDAFALINNFPKATFCVLDNASHNLQIEQKDIFTVFVEDWLNRIKESSGIVLK